MLKVIYVICASIEQITILAGSAWLSHSSGNPLWVIGGVILTVIASFGFAKRVNSWGDLGTTDSD